MSTLVMAMIELLLQLEQNVAISFVAEPPISAAFERVTVVEPYAGGYAKAKGTSLCQSSRYGGTLEFHCRFAAIAA
jgi:hypothetical protein